MVIQTISSKSRHRLAYRERRRAMAAAGLITPHGRRPLSTTIHEEDASQSEGDRSSFSRASEEKVQEEHDQESEQEEEEEEEESTARDPTSSSQSSSSSSSVPASTSSSSSSTTLTASTTSTTTTTNSSRDRLSVYSRLPPRATRVRFATTGTFHRGAVAHAVKSQQFGDVEQALRACWYSPREFAHLKRQQARDAKIASQACQEGTRSSHETAVAFRKRTERVLQHYQRRNRKNSNTATPTSSESTTSTSTTSVVVEEQSPSTPVFLIGLERFVTKHWVMDKRHRRFHIVEAVLEEQAAAQASTWDVFAAKVAASSASISEISTALAHHVGQQAWVDR